MACDANRFMVHGSCCLDTLDLLTAHLLVPKSDFTARYRSHKPTSQALNVNEDVVTVVPN